MLQAIVLQAQGTYIPLGSQTYHYIDRFEIKTGLIEGLHSSNKPYDRKMVMDYIGKVDTGDIEIELTKMDEKTSTISIKIILSLT